MKTHESGHSGPLADICIQLLDGFRINANGRCPSLPPSAQRVVVALALRSHEQNRDALGEMLYPEGRRSRISASLRSALWRANQEVHRKLVESRGQSLRLAEGVEVDLHRWTQRARQLTSDPSIGLAEDDGALVEALSRALLPAWVDEWIIPKQQRWDQLRLHALERLAERYASAGRYMEALEAGLAAVSIEPYRESAHRAVIRAFIAEGNTASAMAQYHRYNRLVARELGCRPTSQLQALVRGLTAEERAR